ncbi:MAG: hypothetical protein Q9162_007514 [Coniocarpon cinnabarinum]
MIAVADGVGAWAQKERGHAALWSRLILHFWSLALEDIGDVEAGITKSINDDKNQVLSPFTANLQTAYSQTVAATAPPTEIFGTTTASGAALIAEPSTSQLTLHVTQLGDSVVLVLRPSKPVNEALLYKTEEQWHWFDCPRQLGTNSPDTPAENAVTERVSVQEGDIIVAISDGVSDNLWIHEVVENVYNSVIKHNSVLGNSESSRGAEAMQEVANELVRAARVIAEDPFAESPFMERAVEEGLPTEGGKLDDISVVVGMVRRT